MGVKITCYTGADTKNDRSVLQRISDHLYNATSSALTSNDDYDDGGYRRAAIGRLLPDITRLY